MTIEMRRATPDDIVKILQLWKRSTESSKTNTPDGLESVLAFPGSAIFLAEENDAITGTVLAAWNGWRGTIYRLAVAEEHRRRGIARDLVRLAENFLKEQGAKRIGAIVLEHNETAVSFWESCGYEADFGGRYHAKDL